MRKGDGLVCAALVLAGALIGAGVALRLTAGRGPRAGAGMRREAQGAGDPAEGASSAGYAHAGPLDAGKPRRAGGRELVRAVAAPTGAETSAPHACPASGERTRPMPRPLGGAAEAALPELEETREALAREKKRSASLEAELDRLRAKLERVKAQRDRLARTLKLSVEDEPGPPEPPTPPEPPAPPVPPAPGAPGGDLAPPAGP